MCLYWFANVALLCHSLTIFSFKELTCLFPRGELEELERKVNLPTTTIGVVGATGSGKSKMMNALLDHENVLPTSCLEACTAVVVQITKSSGPEYEADIEFLTKEVGCLAGKRYQL